MIAGLANGFPDGTLYAIIGRQRGEVYEKNKRSVLDFFEDRCVHVWRRLRNGGPAGTGICGGQAVAEPGGISRYGRRGRRHMPPEIPPVRSSGAWCGCGNIGG